MFKKIPISNFKNKNIYIAPHNNRSILLYKKLSSLGINLKGFIDKNKKGENIYQLENLSYYDYIIIDSPRYWQEISQCYDKKKIILAHYGNNLIFYSDYMNYLTSVSQNKYDVIFMPYNRSNVIDASLVIRNLKKYDIKAAIIDFPISCYENFMQGVKENPDISIVPYDSLDYIDFKALVCSIDWNDGFGRPLIKKCKERNIPTIGLMDGIEDLEDTDYKKYGVTRNAYQTVEYVFATGENDLKYLSNKLDKCSIVGLPKMYNLWNEPFTNPKETQIMINVNFTYGFFEEYRDTWLKQIVEACEALNLKYIVSHHHADKADLSAFNVSKKDAYQTMRESTLVISRFSTIISEALALGKKVIYHNPHNEEAKMYQNPKGAFSISKDKSSLIKSIQKELSLPENSRERATAFLHDQFNVDSSVSPMELIRQNLMRLIQD